MVIVIVIVTVIVIVLVDSGLILKRKVSLKTQSSHGTNADAGEVFPRGHSPAPFGSTSSSYLSKLEVVLSEILVIFLSWKCFYRNLHVYQSFFSSSYGELNQLPPA